MEAHPTDPTPGECLPAAVLLDQDGTLVDSEPLWEQAEREITESLGGRLTPEMRHRMVGAALSRTVEEILAVATRPVPAPEVARRLDARLPELLLERPIPWIPSMPAFLRRLRSAGIPLALVTSSHRPIAEVVAPRVPGGGVDVLVTGDDVVHPKPAPDAYLLAARLLGVDIARCLVVEDSPSGVAAGLASGARVVAIPNQVPIPAQEGLSRVRSAGDLDLATLRLVMGGHVVDVVPEGTANRP